MRILVTAFALALAGPASAATYDISLGGLVIGSLTATGTAIESTLDNTPLGAADGWFRASRTSDSYSAANSDGRRIGITFASGTVTGVTVSPPGERTAASDPAAVSGTVLDPVAGFARVAGASDCPSAFRMYDGRRVIAVTPMDRQIDGGEIVCRYDYTVTAGPGHVSPFRVTKLTLTARYAGALTRMSVRAGPFSVAIVPR